MEKSHHGGVESKSGWKSPAAFAPPTPARL
jgi:hypothetical protein